MNPCTWVSLDCSLGYVPPRQPFVVRGNGDVLWTSDSLTIESTADKTKDRSSCNGRSESNAAYPRISFLFLTNGGDRPSSPLENGQHYTLFFFSFFFFPPSTLEHASLLPSLSLPSPFVTQKTDTGRWNRISFFYFLLPARMDMIKENQSWTLGTCVQSGCSCESLFEIVWFVRSCVMIFFFFFFFWGVELFIENGRKLTR